MEILTKKYWQENNLFVVDKIKIFLNNLQQEGRETQEASLILKKHLRREFVSNEENEQLKEQFYDVLKLVGLGVPFLALPFGTLILPLIVGVAKKCDFNLLPSAFNRLDKNILSVEIIRPTQKIIILRGANPTEKYLCSEHLSNGGIVCSTTSVLDENIKEKMLELHTRNLNKFKEAILNNTNTIVVDDANLKLKYVKKYVEFALLIGLSEQNIEIINLPNNLTPQEIFDRGDHNFTLTEIKRIKQCFDGSPNLTLERVIKELNNSISYSCVLLDEKSKQLLKNIFEGEVPSNFIWQGDHLTIKFGGLEDKTQLDKRVELLCSEIGYSEESVALKVNNYDTKNEISHITLAIHKDSRPSESNKITTWQTIQEIKLIGHIKEIRK